ncbi:phage scaffolding protein [Bacillus nakamurai]|uniref:phage scaffolding protein n=1 Tax=Bacillus nakamurai TaxID=1793963 RepID=UPI0020C24FE3|nr:Clp protease ClpB [Bacillus nakamurai]MCP6682995.1 Clp protease ClpB [Bacillus nakamurai]
MSEEVKESQLSDVADQTTAEVPENKPETQTVTMTQEELNAIIAREKGRVKNKFADYDEMKTKLSDYEKAQKEQEEAEMTELEKLTKQLGEKTEAEASFVKQIEELKAAAEQEKITNEFIKVATRPEHDIAYIDDALRLADLSAVKVEDGKVIGIDDVVKGLVDNKPFLVAKKQTPKPIGQSTNGAGDADGGEIKTLEAQLSEAKKEKNFSKVIELSNKLKALLKK